MAENPVLKRIREKNSTSANAATSTSSNDKKTTSSANPVIRSLRGETAQKRAASQQEIINRQETPIKTSQNGTANKPTSTPTQTQTSPWGSRGTADVGYHNLAGTVSDLESRKKKLEDERIRAQAEIAEGIGNDTSRYDAATKELADVNARLKELNKIRPTYDADKAKSLQDAFTAAENDLITKRGSVDNTVSELDRLGASISAMESNLEQIAAQYDANPTQDLYDRYSNAYKDYEKAISEYNALYADYKPVYDSYSAYDDYMTAARSGDSIGDILSKAAWSGIGQFNSAVLRTLALPEKWLQNLTPGVSTPLTDIADYYEDIRDNFETARAESVYNRGAVTQRVSDLTSGSIAALPQAALAVMTMGTSAVAPAGTLLTGAGNTGLAASVGNSLKDMVQNPSYWYSVIQTLGGDYEEAKAKGAGDLEALASAIISSALNAKVEIGGGLEALPDAVREGGTDAVIEWVKSALDEGKEEVIQSIISGITAKATYDPAREIYSTTNEDAIVNPSRLAEEFAMGAGVGGVLGAGQIAAVDVQNKLNDRRLGKIGSDYSEVAQELVDEGLSFGKNTEAYQISEGLKARLDAGETLSNRDLGRAVIANQRAIEIENANNPAIESNNARNTSHIGTGSVLGSLFAQNDELPSMDKMRSTALEMANKTLGKEGKRVFEMAFRDDGNPSVTYGALTRAYNDGLVNRKGTADNITQAQYDAMFQAGRADASASIKAQAKNASSVPVYGGKSGLDFDDADTKAYVEQHVDQNTAKAIDAVSKLLGIKVRFADSVAGGIANADIENGIVTIEKGNPNPLRFLFGHEITHRMQELAPKEYARLRKAIMEYAPINEHAEFQQRVYLKNNRILGNEESIDEATADYVGRILTDDGELERFIRKAQGDQTLLERLRDLVHDLAVKLSGTEYEKQILAAEKRLTKALRAAAKQADANTNAQKNTAQDGGVNRFSSKMDVLALDGVDWMDNYSSIKEQLMEHAVEINDMEPVAVVDYTPKSSTHLVLDIMDEVAKIGGKNMKNGVVSFAFDETGAKTIYSHAKSNELRAAALSAPYVAKYGKLIAGQKNHENSGLTTLTYAAPVIINETTVNVGVAIQFQANGRPRAVNVGLQSGDVFKLDMKKAPKGPRSRVVRYGQGTSLLTMDAFNDNVAQKESFVNTGISYDSASASVSPSGKLSMKTWNASDYVQERKKAAGEMASVLGISPKKAMDYIDSVNSIAKMIADDRVRLDYEASPGRSSFIGNVEYGGSIDFSTICKKRRLFTGTFEAIQNALPNTALTAEEVLEIRSMMDKKGYEVSCGLCYVEGSRANMGQYAKQFLEQYAKTNPAYLPNMAEINTPNGLEKLRIQHPDVYAAYESFMNKLAQRKPKLYQLSTEYQGEILNKFRKKNGQVKSDDVASKNANGGIRLQSFSDFEIIHLIDSMQVIMDMSRVGLNGQAYTKVPDFAWALGDTGLKINLSLIAKGVDRNGRLILDEKEGMSEKDAMALRNRYSKNVGTIIVVFTDRQLKAAMADERIDYIIPFHRSQWNKGQYEAMGLPANAKDFTSWQNEAYIDPVYNANGKKLRPENYMPNTYWDFSKSGKENAETYLKMCAENNRRPKFHYLLVDNKDGSYSLQPDGSTDGYWKTLIDFKMYDNDGNGSPQMPVRPDFNMEQAKRMLDEYTGGHNAFPAAQDVVDEFVSKYKDSHKGAKFSLKSDSDYMAAVDSGNMDEAQRMVDEAAEESMPNSKIRGKNGKLMPVYHGTKDMFYEFDTSIKGGANGTAEGFGIYTSDDTAVTAAYGDRQIKMYANITKPATSTKKTIKAAKLAALIKDTCKRQAEQLVADGEYDSVKDALMDTWVSNYVYTYDIGMERAYRETANSILQMNDSDMAVIQEVMAGMGIRDYADAFDFYHNSLTPITGFDGIVTQWENKDTVKKSNIILAFDSSQLKSADAVTKDDNGNVIPLSERFNSEKKDIRYSLKEVPPVEPQNGKWKRGATFDEVKSEHPTLFELDADEAEVRNPTQIVGTVKSYRKIYDTLKAEGFDGTILDASSGLGYGTKAGIEEYGFDVEDIEPFPDAIYKPKYTDYSTLDKQYDVIISNAVLNVIPQDLRDAMVVKIGEMLNPGGRAFINVRGTDVKNAGSKVAINEDIMEYFISSTGSYQKGFTKQELVGYLQDALGDGFTVESTNKYGAVAAIVTKDESSFSLKGSEQLVFEIDRILREGKAQKRSDADIQADIRKAVEEVYQGMLQDYGAIKKGENPARDVQVPERTAKDKKVSQTVRTILEAKATPDTLLPKIEELVATGAFSYDVYTDKAAIEDANNAITHSGWAKALVDWTDSMRKGEVSKKNTAMGWALYNNAVNRGDVKTALSVLDYMVRHQRNAAQAVQATRILKQLSPETQLYQVQRSVESLQEELNKRFRGKNAPELKISQELAERYMKAKDQNERDKIMKDIYRDIGRQMPSTFRDKWNAWRYLAMLGNVRTHIRNIIGNAGFAPAVIAKDMTATAIESAVSRVSGGKLNRSKGMVGFSKADRALLSAAWSDFDNVQDMALGGGKYSEFQNANKYIEEGRQVFKFKPLEAARKGNSKALDKEDMWFSRPHYAYAMAQYCKANNITAEQIARGKAIKPARAYAIREAQKATYRDSNALSDAVSTFGKVRDKSNHVKKGAGIVAEGVMPFRKTPANILMRGIEYSPVGLLKGIYEATSSVRNGEKTGAEAIDSIAAGLTGTGLVALGLFMAAEGLVRGSGGDDEKEKEFEELMGHQAYSLEVGGKSVTLDWLAPESMPFFVGVNIWEAMETDGLTFAEALDTVSMITEPLLEMSMLQSLNDVFEKVGNTYNAGIKGLPAAISNAVTSYLTQALPTVLGQAERTGQEVRMTTYTDKSASLNSDMQYALGTASARIPGIDYNQIPYIDAWGRTESTGGTGERAFNNFLNPAYTSDIDTSAMEEELLRLYEATGEASVLPKRAAKYFTVDGERKDLTAEEYVQYATLRGQSAYELVTDLVNSQQYKDMSEEERVKAVKDAYDLANQQAKAAISDYAAESWIEKAAEAEKKYGISQDTYISLKTQASGIQSLKDKDGETIENSKGLQIMEMIYETPGLTEKQRQAMFEYLGVGKTIRHYNKALVKEKLAKLRKQAK